MLLTASGCVPAQNLHPCENNCADCPGNKVCVLCQCTPPGLPVEIISFTATQSEHGVLIRWATATETNNDYFELQRSRDNTSWHQVARIKGYGNSMTPVNYQSTDTASVNGTNYYRLKQMDFDGKFSYSKTIACTFNPEGHSYRYFTLLGARIEGPIPSVYIRQAVGQTGEVLGYEKIVKITE